MKNTIMFLLKLNFKKALLWNSSISESHIYTQMANLLCITLYVTELKPQTVATNCLINPVLYMILH